MVQDDHESAPRFSLETGYTPDAPGRNALERMGTGGRPQAASRTRQM
jgi:hypothetical protein